MSVTNIICVSIAIILVLYGIVVIKNNWKISWDDKSEAETYSSIKMFGSAIIALIGGVGIILKILSVI